MDTGELNKLTAQLTHNSDGYIYPFNPLEVAKSGKVSYQELKNWFLKKAKKTNEHNHNS